MNLIQRKQVQGLDNEISSLSGALNATGQILEDFLSGDSTFSGTKTFTGNAIFATGVEVRGDLTGVVGKFNKIGINLPTAGRPAEGIHISGANLLVEDNFSETLGGTIYSNNNYTTGTISGTTLTGTTIQGGTFTGQSAGLTDSVKISGGHVPVWSGGAPSAYNSPGTIGALAYDSTHVYICTGNNAWGRAGIAAW